VISGLENGELSKDRFSLSRESSSSFLCANFCFSAWVSTATGSQSELRLFLGLERGVPPGDLQKEGRKKKKKNYRLLPLFLCRVMQKPRNTTFVYTLSCQSLIRPRTLLILFYNNSHRTNTSTPNDLSTRFLACKYNSMLFHEEKRQ